MRWDPWTQKSPICDSMISLWYGVCVMEKWWLHRAHTLTNDSILFVTKAAANDWCAAEYKNRLGAHRYPK